MARRLIWNTVQADTRIFDIGQCASNLLFIRGNHIKKLTENVSKNVVIDKGVFFDTNILPKSAQGADLSPKAHRT